MRLLLKLTVYTLLAIWIFALLARSGIHLQRIYKEFAYPVEGYYDDVKICGERPENGEKLMYYVYLNLGEICEK